MARITSAAIRRAAVWLGVTAALAGLSLAASAKDLSIRATDADNQPLANAVILADWAGAPVISGTNQIAEVAQRHLKFHPHVLVVAAGTSVTFPNHDRTRHQVYSFSPTKTFNLKLYVGRPQRPIVFDKAGVVTLGCDIHDYMQAFIVVTAKPRWAITDDQGRAILHGLPDNKPVELSLWHPWMPSDNGRVERKVDAAARAVAVQLDVMPPSTATRLHGSSLQDQFDQLAK
ncbi:MAG: methylamine utilization protein [Salinisphaera sp.]|jgi:plastocyanin|nr:methylamine utilization protein [Salinisphaera sp.]